MKRAELQYDHLFKEVHRPYCGRAHRLFGSAPVAPADLAEESFVLTGADEGDELTLFRLQHGLGRNVAGVSDHLEEAKRLVILGIGLCFLPEAYAQSDVDAGRLWPLIPDVGAPTTDLFVITNPNISGHAARRLFIDEITSGAAGAGGPARPDDRRPLTGPLLDLRPSRASALALVITLRHGSTHLLGCESKLLALPNTINSGARGLLG